MATKKESVEFGMAILDAKLSHVRDDVSEIKAIMRDAYIRREEFSPVKQVVFGMVAVILFAVLGGIVTLVLRNAEPAGQAGQPVTAQH